MVAAQGAHLVVGRELDIVKDDQRACRVATLSVSRFNLANQPLLLVAAARAAREEAVEGRGSCDAPLTAETVR